jgi:2'-5' RNA ligase
MRLFAAIELSEPAHKHLAGMAREWQERWGEELLGLSDREYPKPSWVRPANLHVTLKFFGEIAEPDVNGLCGALASVTLAGAMRLNADRVECLPPRGPVRVIAAGIGGDVGRLRQLHSEVERAVEVVGIAPERRDFHPHVTLARAKVPLPRHTRDSLAKAGTARLPGPAFDVTEFVLMESHLSPQGATYVRVSRFPLGNPPAQRAEGG